MMTLRTLPYLLACLVLVIAIMPAKAAVEIGKPAPAIKTTDINGNDFNLEDHKGKIVVLEWFNKGCPFVQKHYNSNNMQELQKTANEKGVEWVTIISSAEGKQGYVTPEEAKADLETFNASPSALLLDPSGEIGNAYGAKTTPHMFVIDTEGNVAYAGAIDNNSSPNPDVIPESKNYVMDAIDALQAGNTVQTSETAPYGCGVKY